MYWYQNLPYRDRSDRGLADLYVFVSYTGRESEVEVIQPLIDDYCRELWEWADRNGLHVFYDHFSLEDRQFGDHELARALTDRLLRSDVMTAFLSPEYLGSRWCQLEWMTQYAKLRRGELLAGGKDFPDRDILRHVNIGDIPYVLDEQVPVDARDAHPLEPILEPNKWCRPATHAIYWKPDIMEQPNSRPLEKTLAVEGTHFTDVTVAFDFYGSYVFDSEAETRAKEACVREIVEVITDQRFFDFSLRDASRGAIEELISRYEAGEITLGEVVAALDSRHPGYW